MLRLVIDSGILPLLVNLLGHHEVNVVVSVFRCSHIQTPPL